MAGANSTTHSELPDICEKFLIHKAAEQVMDRDGDTQGALKQGARAAQQLETIKGAWTQMREDVDYIPIVNDEWLFG